MLNRKEEPPITNAVEFDLKLKDCEQFTLDNGTRVYAVNAGAQDVLQLECVFYAGNWYEEKNIVAATVNFMLKNGTTSRSAFAINEYFDFYGAFLNRHCYNETATLTLHTLTKHLPSLLPVMAELISESIFPDTELAVYRQNQKQRLEVSLKKCDFVANRLIDAYLYGAGHPYGKYTSKEDYDAIEKDALNNFFRKYYTEGNCILFVAGKLPADIQQQLNKNFGSLPFNRRPVPTIDHKQQPSGEKTFNVTNDVNGVQGAIRIARHFPNRHHPDFIKVQVLNNIFGGYFGTRLMSNIREDKGYTYGIHSYIQNHIHDTAWVISTEAGRDVCSAAVTEIYREMERLCNEEVDAEELNLVRNYMMGSILGDLDGPFHIIARWKNYVLNNLTESYFYNSIHSIKTISAAELQQLAQKYFNKDDFYELVVV